jgi:superfamily I DNA/RNA helicase
MALNFSTYQIALFDFIQADTGSVIIDAKAGSGKTTTIVEACNRLPEKTSILFLAFNKAIVEELKLRLPEGVACKTFNGIGWSSWLSFAGKRVQIEGNKTRNIIRDNFRKEDEESYGSFVNKCVALAKSNGLTPEDLDETWMGLIDHHGVSPDVEGSDIYRGIDLCRKTLRESIRLSTSVCDFDDQIYMPWLKGSTFQKFDVIFIDEAQDTNSIQCDLLKRMLKPEGRLIAVGDPNQAIYGFRGADHNAMNNIREVFNSTVLPLSISYRCGKSIIQEARKYVNDIEAFSGAAEGEVVSMDKYSIEDFKPSDAILCRNNAPLVEIAYQIISRGRGINFMGKDLGTGLKTLINRMEANDLDDLASKLDRWLDKEIEKAIRKGQEDKVDALTDKVKCITIFMDNLPSSRQTVNDLIRAIDSLFEGGGRGITLASVHKSKGREWDRVFILDFNTYMPSKWANKDWQKVQENNLIYVAITRAKHHLCYLASNGWKDEPSMKGAFEENTSVNISAKVERPKKTSPTSFNPLKK